MPLSFSSEELEHVKTAALSGAMDKRPAVRFRRRAD
jgi:hypothetical protein